MQLNIWIHFVPVPRIGGNSLTSLPEIYIGMNSRKKNKYRETKQIEFDQEQNNHI